MPFQPPSFGRATPRRAWAQSPRLRTPTPRKRGRAGQRDRAIVIAEEPLCRLCLAADRTTATAIVDHIVPLAWGGTDERSNKQGLCVRCHDEKSERERAIDRAARGIGLGHNGGLALDD